MATHNFPSKRERILVILRRIHGAITGRGNRNEVIRDREFALTVGFFVTLALGFAIAFNQNDYPQPHDSVSIPKPSPEPRNFTGVINLYSPTFGAQSDIDVHITLYPDSNSLNEFNNADKQYSAIGNNSGLHSHYYMIFEGSFCDNISRDIQERYERIGGCAMKLPFDEEKNVYQNWGIFRYTIEGTYGVALSKELPPSGELKPSEQFIRIAPLEAKLNDDNSKLIAILTVAGIYLAIVAIHFESRRF